MARRRTAMLVALGLVASLLLPAAFSAPSLIYMPSDVPVNPAVSFARGLTLDYYVELCPDVRDLVRTVVLDALGEDMSIAAGLLRIFFHDCFPQGCDASILLNGTGTPFGGEQQMPPNRGLQPKALQLIEEIRAKVHAVCGPTVSCADITSLATHDAVVASGGKPYYVPLGRMDSRRAAAWSYVRDLPHFTADISEVIATFRSRRYFDATDVVALSGAHSIGKVQCSTLAHRFREEDSDFVQKLRKNCTAGVDRMQYLDVNTPQVLDNAYYRNLKEGKGVLPTDQLLNGDDRTKWLVDGFADDGWWFWNQFGTSMSKMGMLEGYFGNVGEVRHVSCSQRNPPTSTA